MKTMRKFLIGMLAASAVGSAQAIPTTLTDPILQTPGTAIGGSAVSLIFDLTHFGYDSSLHSLDSALLSLVLQVDGNNANQINNANSSMLTISLPGQSDYLGSVSSFTSPAPAQVPITFEALNFASGVLQFSLTRGPNPGTVTLTHATLSVSASLLAQEPPGGSDNPGTNPTNPVPEPGTLALLALGLIGGALIRRRKA